VADAVVVRDSDSDALTDGVTLVLILLDEVTLVVADTELESDLVDDKLVLGDTLVDCD